MSHHPVVPAKGFGAPAATHAELAENRAPQHHERRTGAISNTTTTCYQHGAVLLTALFLMLAVLMIGVSAARTALNAEKSARQDRDRHIAFNAAEAALRDAERDIEGGADPASARAALFAPASSSGFADGCGQDTAGANLGLCRPAAAGATPAWQALDLAGADAQTVPYGRFTGAGMAVAGGILPARLPRYIIELVPLAGAAPADGAFYRVTAIGFGSRDTTRVVLQSYYRKPAPPDPAAPAPQVTASSPAVPAGRISWREIANWPELHQATLI